jgi:recombinational DNA repair protein (RecF pathway)
MDLNAILRLKNSEAFTRDDAFEFLLRFNEKLKSRCNRCFAGFTDAYMNEVLIEMGFNPIVKRTANKSVWYNTSGFTFYLKAKFSDDQRLVKLIDYIFDWYLK